MKSAVFLKGPGTSGVIVQLNNRPFIFKPPICLMPEGIIIIQLERLQDLKYRGQKPVIIELLI